MFNKILIANRGEIACRVINTAKKLGIKTVAVYSEPDKESRHVKLADEAFCIGDALVKNSYLNIEKIIKVAKQTDAQAVHPGYGFLSENAEFARQLEQAKIIFIGPSSDAILKMGSKSIAKQIMVRARVPVIPGYHGENQDTDKLLIQAHKIGFPVLIKAVAGGGGKGMRVVTQEKDFSFALAGAQREAMKSFGNDEILIEKLIEKPRHIEIQIFCDSFGNAIHLFERDCSIQRRHQKVIEEAPATNFTQKLRDKMGKTAIAAAQAINYIGAGTVEFLLDEKNNFYFMEMNTRLQVEHPVTEMITNTDLVEWQLLVANKEKLPLTQKELSIKGHAIEARIYAEDPNNNFLPSTGKIEYLSLPHASDNIRIDLGILSGDEISIHYDPMLAKLIVWGNTRENAISLIKQALSDFHLFGLKTNINFLKAIISNDDFSSALITTDFLDTHEISNLAINEYNLNYALIAASLYQILTKKQHEPWDHPDAFRLNLDNTQQFCFMFNDEKKQCQVTSCNGLYQVKIKDLKFKIDVELHNNILKINFEAQSIKAKIIELKNQLHINIFDDIFTLKKHDPILEYSKDESCDGQLTAPMPGMVISIPVKNGQAVKLGDSLMIIEAMKMEHTIAAPHDGIVENINYQVGDLVSEGEELLALNLE